MASPRAARTGPPAFTAAPDANGPRLVLLLMVLALTLLGFVMIYSASSISDITEESGQASYLLDQLVFSVIGIAAAFVLWKVIPYRVWAGPAVWVIWGIAVVLLLLTALLGLTALGAQRWLSLGPFSMQPSEFVKIALVLMAARLFSDLRAGAVDGRTFVVQAVVREPVQAVELGGKEFAEFFVHDR